MRSRVKAAPLNIKKRNLASPRPALKRPTPLVLDPIQVLFPTTWTALLSPFSWPQHVHFPPLMPTSWTHSPDSYGISPNPTEPPTFGGPRYPTISALGLAGSASQMKTEDSTPHKHCVAMTPFRWSLKRKEVNRGAHFGPRKPRSKQPPNDTLASFPRSPYPSVPSSSPIAHEDNVSGSGIDCRGRRSVPDRITPKALPPLPPRARSLDGATQRPASTHSKSIPRPPPLPLANMRESPHTLAQTANTQTVDKLSHEFWQSVSMIEFQELGHMHSPCPSSVVESFEDPFFMNGTIDGTLWESLSRRDRIG